jgi:hypothetical protein
MARKATKDTYAIDSSSGVEIRRRVFAGQVVPNAYQLEEGSYEEVEGGLTSVGPTQEPPPDKPAPEADAEDDSTEVSAPSKKTTRKKASGAE